MADLEEAAAGKITRAPLGSGPRASRSIWSVIRLSPVLLCMMNTWAAASQHVQDGIQLQLPHLLGGLALRTWLMQDHLGV